MSVSLRYGEDFLCSPISVIVQLNKRPSTPKTFICTITESNRAYTEKQMHLHGIAIRTMPKLTKDQRKYYAKKMETDGSDQGMFSSLIKEGSVICNSLMLGLIMEDMRQGADIKLLST